MLVDLGHHAQGTNVEQIVALLADEGRLGGFHFNNRKYADDDLIVGSVNPFELFLIFCELAGAGGPLPRLTIDQAHNVEAKVEAMVLSVVNLQEAYAKALLVDRAALAARRSAATCWPATRRCSTRTAPTSGRCARRSAPTAARPRTRSRRTARPATVWPSAPPPAWPEGGDETARHCSTVVPGNRRRRTSR